MVGVQQSLTLSCEAEGNPPPTYTWTPCDPEQVCDKDTLHISQVLNDANFTFRVANVYGDDSKTARLFVSHMYIVVMHLTAVSLHMYQHDILIIIGSQS